MWYNKAASPQGLKQFKTAMMKIKLLHKR